MKLLHTRLDQCGFHPWTKHVCAILSLSLLHAKRPLGFPPTQERGPPPGCLTWQSSVHRWPAGPQSVQDLPSHAGPGLTLAPHVCQTQRPVRQGDKDSISVGKAINITFTAGRLCWKYFTEIEQIEQKINWRESCAPNNKNQYECLNEWVVNMEFNDLRWHSTSVKLQL